MTEFLQETLSLYSANKSKESELRETLRRLEAERAQVERRQDAIIVSACRTLKLDLSEVGHEALLGHLVQLKSKSQDIGFKKAAAQRAQTFLADFTEEVSIRGLTMTLGIDPEIDMHSKERVPVIARFLGSISPEQEKLLEQAGLVVKINASNRSPMTIADGEILVTSMLELARTLGMRFDRRPERTITVEKPGDEMATTKGEDRASNADVVGSSGTLSSPLKPASNPSFPRTGNFNPAR